MRAPSLVDLAGTPARAFKALWGVCASVGQHWLLPSTQGCDSGQDPCCVSVPLKEAPSIYDSASDCAACRGVTRIAKTSGCALSGFVPSRGCRAHVSQQLTVLPAGV